MIWDATYMATPEFWLWTVVFAIFAYLIGSISFGKVIGKLFNKDLTKSGSGNVGATNAGRALGAKGFILVLLGDLSKVLVTGIAINYIMLAFNLEGSMPLALIFGVIGNNFPIYFKFKGGKGVAAFVGYLAVVSWPALLVGLGIMGLGILITRRVSVSSIMFVTGAAIFITLQGYFIPDMYLFTSVDVIGATIASWVGAGMITAKHWKNIDRVIKREEVTVDGVQEFRWVVIGGTKQITKDLAKSTHRAVKDTAEALVKPHTIPEKMDGAYKGWKRKLNNFIHKTKNPKEAGRKHVRHYKNKSKESK